MEFEQTVKMRHSVRIFLEKEISADKIKKILEIVSLGPSAGNLQAYKIYIVRDLQTKKALARAAFDQSFITEAPVVMVFCANQEESALKYDERGAELYSIQDATIAATYAQLAAADLNIGTVWVGAFNPDQVKNILKTDKYPVTVIPFGYSQEESFIRERKNIQDISEEI